MLQTIADFEQLLVDSIIAGVEPLHEAVDGLLSCLLSGVDGYSHRPTDGVLFKHTEVTDCKFLGSGLVVLIDGQLVEPLRVELSLNGSKTELQFGLVCLGDEKRAAVGYGSKEHRRMALEILADPQLEYSWKERFRRDDAGWHRVAT